MAVDGPGNIVPSAIAPTDTVDCLKKERRKPCVWSRMALLFECNMMRLFPDDELVQVEHHTD